jgi:hypothetical protein
MIRGRVAREINEVVLTELRGAAQMWRRPTVTV